MRGKVLRDLVKVINILSMRVLQEEVTRNFVVVCIVLNDKLMLLLYDDVNFQSS